MLIRLLVVVLTLVGPLPFRVCTCAAAVPAQTAAGEPIPARPTAATRKACGCDHGTAHPAPVRQVAPPHVHADDSAPSRDAPHPDRHESDCPAANPFPVVRDAVTPVAVDVPTDDVGPVPAVWGQTVRISTTSALRPPAPPRASKLPLYITLLSIRN